MKILLIGTDAKASLNFRRTLMERCDQAVLIANACAEFRSLPDVIESPLKRSSFNILENLTAVLKLTRLIKSIQPDCVFVFFQKPFILGTLAARLAGVKRIVGMLEGLGYFFTKRPEPDGFKIRLIRGLLSCAYKGIIPLLDSVIFLNRDDCTDISKIKRATQSFCLGGIGVPLHRFPYSKPPIDPIRFVFIGRMLYDKGIREFLMAARFLKSKYPHVFFVVVGGIDLSNPSSVHTIEQYRDCVEITNTVADIYPILKSASVVVLPSYREGVPMSLQEAMVAGRPIVASYVPGCKDMIRGNGYFVKPFDIQDLIQKMEIFIKNPHKIEKMGIQSHKRGRRIYNRDKKDMRLMQILEGECLKDLIENLE
jgi:glycosyltransferase involved in cell wall biosynthesis